MFYVPPSLPISIRIRGMDQTQKKLNHSVVSSVPLIEATSRPEPRIITLILNSGKWKRFSIPEDIVHVRTEKNSPKLPTQNHTAVDAETEPQTFDSWNGSTVYFS